MKTRFYLNDKKITKKAATELVGAERLKEMIKEAKRGFMIDPLTHQSWFIGRNGCLSIEFI